MGNLIKWITQTWRKVIDPYNQKGYTRITYLVPHPTMQQPYPCILVSIRNGHSKLFFRVASVEQYEEAVGLNTEERQLLVDALNQARLEADLLEEDMKLLLKKKHLQDGVRWVQTDTGEIVAQAEQILREG